MTTTTTALISLPTLHGDSCTERDKFPGLVRGEDEATGPTLIAPKNSAHRASSGLASLQLGAASQ